MYGIDKITVRNIRPFGQNGKDTVFNIKPLTILIGPNNSGKSTLLKLIKCITLNMTSKNFNNNVFNLRYGFGEKTTFSNLISSDTTEDFIKIIVETTFVYWELKLKKHYKNEHLAYISEITHYQTFDVNHSGFSANIEFKDGKYMFKSIKLKEMDLIAAEKIFWNYNSDICYDCADKFNESDSKFRIYFMFNDIIKSLNLNSIRIEKESNRFYVKLNNNKRIYISDLLKKYLNNNNFNIGKYLYKSNIKYKENKLIIDIIQYITESIQHFAELVAYTTFSNVYENENSLLFYNEYSGINPQNYDLVLINKLNLLKRPHKEKKLLEEKFSLYLRRFDIYENIKIEFINQEESKLNFAFLVKRGKEYLPIGFDNLGIEPSKIYFYFVLFLINSLEYLKSISDLNIFNLISSQYFISQKNKSAFSPIKVDDTYNERINYNNVVNYNSEFLKLKVLEGFMHIIEEQKGDFKLKTLENDIIYSELQESESIIKNYFKELKVKLNENFEENFVLKNKIDSFFNSIIENNNLINWKKQLESISFFVNDYLQSLNSELLPEIKINKYLDDYNIKYYISNDTINFYKNINGVESDISNFGSGLKNLLRFKLFIETILISRTNISFIEEPEINLHPNKIKDFTKILIDKLLSIVDETKSNIGHAILIETHSEYFIRNLQLFIANTQNNIEKNIVIHYFLNDSTSEDYIKEITFNKDGSLSDDFGPGFYDEAANLIYELYSKSSEE